MEKVNKYLDRKACSEQGKPQAMGRDMGNMEITHGIRTAQLIEASPQKNLQGMALTSEQANLLKLKTITVPTIGTTVPTIGTVFQSTEFYQHQANEVVNNLKRKTSSCERIPTFVKLDKFDKLFKRTGELYPALQEKNIPKAAQGEEYYDSNAICDTLSCSCSGSLNTVTSSVVQSPPIDIERAQVCAAIPPFPSGIDLVSNQNQILLREEIKYWSEGASNPFVRFLSILKTGK